MNIIVRLEFELPDYDSAVQYFNPYTPGTSPRKQCKTVFNSVFSFLHGCWTKVKEPNHLHYLPIAMGKYRFISFPITLAQSETQTASPRIWTQVTEFIFYNDNRYAKSSSGYECVRSKKKAYKYLQNMNKQKNIVCKESLRDWLDWLTDFRSISTCTGLFHVWWWGKCVYITFIFIFFVLLFLKRVFFFLHTGILYQVFISNTNNLHTDIWFQVFLSNTYNYLVSSNYFNLIIIICLHIVTWFQVNNP